MAYCDCRYEGYGYLQNDQHSKCVHCNYLVLSAQAQRLPIMLLTLVAYRPIYR